LNNQAGTLQNGLNSTSGGQTQPYGSEANTEQQLVALKMLRMGQQNLPQEAQPLVEQLVNLEPDSAQAQQVSAQIAAQWTGSPQDLKTFQTLGAIRQIDSMANGLKNTLANLDPASDQAKLLQGRLAQLNNKRLSLQAQDLARRNLPTEAQPLADQLADLDPASAEAQQVNARIAALWTGSPQELKTFQTLGAIRQINSMAASLNNMLANLDPASAQAQQIQAQLDVLKAKRDSLQGQLQQPGNSGTVRIPTP
jgi:chromosome segregation ATPase